MARFFDPRFDQEPEDLRDLTSRSDLRRERKASEARLMALAEALVALSERQLAKLELEEDLLDAVGNARAIRSAAAKRRALRAVRANLRAADADPIQKKLDALLNPRR